MSLFDMMKQRAASASPAPIKSVLKPALTATLPTVPDDLRSILQEYPASAPLQAQLEFAEKIVGLMFTTLNMMSKDIGHSWASEKSPYSALQQAFSLVTSRLNKMAPEVVESFLMSKPGQLADLGQADKRNAAYVISAAAQAIAKHEQMQSKSKSAKASEIKTGKLGKVVDLGDDGLDELLASMTEVDQKPPAAQPAKLDIEDMELTELDEDEDDEGEADFSGVLGELTALPIEPDEPKPISTLLKLNFTPPRPRR